MLTLEEMIEARRCVQTMINWGASGCYDAAYDSDCKDMRTKKASIKKLDKAILCSMKLEKMIKAEESRLRAIKKKMKAYCGLHD